MTHAPADHDAFVHVRNELRSLTRSLCRNFEQSITANIQKQFGDMPNPDSKHMQLIVTFTIVMVTRYILIKLRLQLLTSCFPAYSLMKIVPIYHHSLLAVLFPC